MRLQDRIERGIIGAILAVPTLTVFWLGYAVRSCLPDHSGYMTLIVLEGVIMGYVVTVPVIIAGFLIGFFLLPLKLRTAPAILWALVLLAVVFTGGYAGGSNECLPA